MQPDGVWNGGQKFEFRIGGISDSGCLANKEDATMFLVNLLL